MLGFCHPIGAERDFVERLRAGGCGYQDGACEHEQESE
jgi:hypothetical protein